LHLRERVRKCPLTIEKEKSMLARIVQHFEAKVKEKEGGEG